MTSPTGLSRPWITEPTVEKCAARCQGYDYFGFKFERECYCGNQLGGQSTPEPQCRFLCVGNSREWCGAANRLNVYTKRVAPTTSIILEPVTTATAAESAIVTEPPASSEEPTTTSEEPVTTEEPTITEEPTATEEPVTTVSDEPEPTITSVESTTTTGKPVTTASEEPTTTSKQASATTSDEPATTTSEEAVSPLTQTISIARPRSGTSSRKVEYLNNDLATGTLSKIVSGLESGRMYEFKHYYWYATPTADVRLSQDVGSAGLDSDTTAALLQNKAVNIWTERTLTFVPNSSFQQLQISVSGL